MKKQIIILTSISLLSGSLTNLGYLHFYHSFHPTKKFSSNGISNINFSDLNQGYYAKIVGNKAQNPENVDINVNYYEYNGDDAKLKEVILTKLDFRYSNYFNAFPTLLYPFTENQSEEQIQFCDPQNISQPKAPVNAVFKDFNIANLNSLGANPALGDWRTFNLKLVYLPNNTSFEFSLNLCHFDLLDYSGSTSITLNNNKQNLPTMKTWKDIYHEGSPWYFFSTVADDDTNKDVVLNVSQIKDFASGAKVAKFDTVHQAGFFLDPLSYTYSFEIYQRMFSIVNNYLMFTTTDQFDLSKLQTTSWTDLTTGLKAGTFNTTAVPADMPYITDDFSPYGKGFEFNPLEDADHGQWSFRCQDSEWSRGSIHKGLTSDATAVVAYTEEGSPSNLEIINAAMSGGDNFIDGYHDYLEFGFDTWGDSLTTGFKDNVFYNAPEGYQLKPNSIVNYSNFIYFTNYGSSQINMYGYKNDALNNYYTYAIENSDIPGNTFLNINEQAIDKITINSRSFSILIHPFIQLKDLIINNQPTLLRIKITPKAGVSTANLYYGYDAEDNTINFNLIVYPAHYPTFHNYIDFDNVDNRLSYNMDLKIYIDKSLLNTLNFNKLAKDYQSGFLNIMDYPLNYSTSGWGWINYQNKTIYQVLNNFDLFNTLDNYITNPNHFGSLDRTTYYTKGIKKLLYTFIGNNIYFNIKFHLNYNQFSPSSVYDNFNNLVDNELFYEQIIGLGASSAK